VLWLAREELRASISQITLCILKTVQYPLRCADVAISRDVRCLLIDVSISSTDARTVLQMAYSAYSATAMRLHCLVELRYCNGNIVNERPELRTRGTRQSFRHWRNHRLV